MTTRSIRNRINDSTNIWPGFVDVLATLLIVIIFVLMVFTVSQIYLSDAISGRDKALEDLKNQINELSRILVIESKEKQLALEDLSTTKSELKSEKSLTTQLEKQVAENEKTISFQSQDISILSFQIEELLNELQIVAKALQTYEGIAITSLDTKGLGERINKALATRIEELNIINEKLSLSQKETAKQLEIVRNLNSNLTAINESLGLDDAGLVEQLDAIKNKNSELALVNQQLEDLNKKLILNEEQLQNQVEQYQIITEELITLNENLDLKDKALLDQLDLIKIKNNELSQLNENLIKKDTTIFDLRGKISELNNILSVSQETQLSQQDEIINMKSRILQLEKEKEDIAQISNKDILDAELRASSTLEQVEYLSSEIEILKTEINTLNAALEASEVDVLTKELQIEVLGERLNKALTSKVFELQKYRSEFFGRLQDLLGERKDIKVVGDRFIFESELLFDSGSATLQEEGEKKLKQIGLTLQETTNNIPDDIDWIIQVEGHTDKNPISTAKFPSNWELSTARANTVLKLLLELGFNPKRLSAAGYGEFYPISQGETIKDFEQNRRIELKLTSR
tara:strand:- start:3033 stop:4757 length:1725 start_codon:yes stop_codon:yes gene_type:complete